MGGPEEHSGKVTTTGSNETPPSAEGAKKKYRFQEIETYAGVADPLTRVIMAEGYPEAVLTAEQLALLKGAVSKEIDGIQEDPVPRFRSTHLKAGAAIVRCANAVMLKWLEDRIGGIVPWESAQSDGPGSATEAVQGRSLGLPSGPPEASIATLTRLKRQNSGLCTTDCRVFTENGAISDGRNLVLGIPEFSVLKLRALDFKPYLGMDHL